MDRNNPKPFARFLVVLLSVILSFALIGLVVIVHHIDMMIVAGELAHGPGDHPFTAGLTTVNAAFVT